MQMSDISKELVEAVRTAATEGTRLAIVGGGSKSFIGRESCGEPLQVAGHAGITDYQPSELVITARAGTSIATISQTLEENGQVLPFEAPLYQGKATLAGTLACNIAGPARPWKGSVRDATLGVRLINGRGEHLTFGGQVLKNVAGYDVSRLQAGAMGTLGLMTEISLRVLPKPAATATLVSAMAAHDAILKMNELMGQACPLSGAAWIDYKLYLRLEGTERAIDAAMKKIAADSTMKSHSIWQDIREQSLEFFAGELPTWRFSVDSNARHRMANQDWLIDWGGAQRWIRGNYDKSELETMAHDMGGHVSLFRHGDRKNDVFHTMAPPMQKLQLNLKNAFDPNGILNPGRMYSWM